MPTKHPKTVNLLTKKTMSKNTFFTTISTQSTKVMKTLHKDSIKSHSLSSWKQIALLRLKKAINYKRGTIVEKFSIEFGPVYNIKKNFYSKKFLSMFKKHTLEK